MDAFGHVNNVVYLRYLQEARVDMLFVHAPRQGAERLADGVVVARHEIAYRAPLHYRARPIRVETWVSEVTNSSFTLGYEVLDVGEGDGDGAGEGGADGRVVYAVASTVLVPYDLHDSRPRRVAPEERAVLSGFLEPDGPRPGRAA